MPEKNEVGDAFAAALRRMLDEKPGRTVSAAAEQLEVSRQAFHAYLKGKLPRRKTLNRAMNLWNLKLELRDQAFGKGAFGAKAQEKAEDLASKPAQLALWEMLDTVTQKDLRVTMRRMGKVLRFDVRIEIPA
jgi:predicted transcriptional regulator